MTLDDLKEKHAALEMKLAALEMKIEAAQIKFEAFNLILRLTQGEESQSTEEAAAIHEEAVVQSTENSGPKKRGRKKGSKNSARREVNRKKDQKAVKELQAIDVERQKQLDAVLSQLSQHKKATLDDLHKGIGGKKSTVLNSIAQLKKDKQIVFKSTPKPGYYSLANAKDGSK